MPNSGFNETAATPAPTESASAEGYFGTEIRELGYADLPAVVSIERRSFSSPWSVGMFVLEMSRRSGITLAAVEDGKVIGCVILSRYDQAWHLMKIAVAPEQRRRGIASTLVEAAFSRLESETPVTLEVRPSNHSAIALYERFGFVSLGLRKGYYPDNGEDALIMWKGDPVLAGVPVESRGEPGDRT
ncbi:MAG: ribosomal protein S18-alanine N-acetyltransferase [Actinomycetota bacterium]|nr:ribosomal protein S18-alanine N-acetyltransferase [Actinomycetota bacterium]